ncbi:MAG: phosphatase PAP2 family protein [Candidatus Edwardsbacteria bacterium]|nr:phosphatase PAP2 family protein [Candidatus Edwardsbacteria bacterium]
MICAALQVSTSSVGCESLDDRLFRQIHDRWQRSWLDKPMARLTAVGNAGVGIGICAGVGLFCGSKGYDAAKLALTADGGAAMITYGLKYAVNRQRPEGSTDRSNSSFPSGHATGAFALATVFSHEYPKLAIPCYAIATGIALSRIYLGRHYPSDALAGAVIGYASARLVLHFRDKILDIDASRCCKRKKKKQPTDQKTD